MKEGTVSSGVALRPRPTEVQPHFLGSNIIIGIFFKNCKCHVSILISVTIFLLLIPCFYLYTSDIFCCSVHYILSIGYFIGTIHNCIYVISILYNK